MMKQHYYTNSDINALVYDFAVAHANSNFTAARSVCAKLVNTWMNFNHGIVDVEDHHVLYNAVMTTKNTLDKGLQDDRQKPRYLEAAARFNRLWKEYSRQCWWKGKHSGTCFYNGVNQHKKCAITHCEVVKNG